MDIGDWIAAVAALIALAAMGFAARQAHEAKEARHAAQAQAAAAKDSAEIAEAGVKQAQRSAKAAEDSAAEARTANQYASEQLALTRADREDRERQEQRDIVIDVLRTGRIYASALEGIVTIMGAMADYVEITRMDSWNTFTQAGESYNKARLHARYAVKAPEITAVIHDLETVAAKLTERTGKLVRSKRDARGHAPIEDILSALEIPHGINHLLDRLEELANQHFRQPGEKA
ncbi:hypothetical protein [Saccharothrix variisporea]|uniref:Uncharacterized protein n=1 Tax=Saccharothrix variisporea TaxID=543527 RepID=A0A495X5W5_9PSEU|nr:hypothetical protein [Saccharothrix variisporea]RKT69440.1 hypothetical protein DFJ66_2668 [Saccharothrix variisporea]